jgi:hypothetical protein
MVEARVDRSWIFVVTVAALVLLPISTSTQAHAEEEGRIQITFSKPGHGSGSGYLFYQGQKYGLDVSATKIGRIRVTTIDFIGTASNLRSAGDILGTYNGGDSEAALVRRAMTVRLENARKLERCVHIRFVRNDVKECRLATLVGIVQCFKDRASFR